MPFFDENPATVPHIAARLRRAVAQNRHARRTGRAADRPATGPGNAPAPGNSGPPSTTADATIRPVGSATYRRLGWAPGERHVVREDLGARAAPDRVARRRSLLYFSQHTDIHITDAQSPARLVGAQALSWVHPGLDASHRPQETMTTQVFDQLVRATNRLVISPLSGAPMAFCAQTGDHTDNRTASEADWWHRVLTGGPITPNTGAPGRYEGVQRSGLASVWNPDRRDGDRPQRLGFPYLPGVLDAAVSTFDAAGLDVPWYGVHGNHDRLFVGTFGVTGGVRIDLVEERRRRGGIAPVSAPALLAEITRATVDSRLRGGGWTSADRAPRWNRRGWLAVTPDPDARRPLDDEAFTRLVSPGTARDTWWSRPEGDRVQVIGLDTSNHTDGEGGRIGPRQQTWLEQELARHPDRLVVIMSHHNSWVMDNAHDDASDPGPALDGEGLVVLLARHPNVVLWLNGHSHEHRIAAHRGPDGEGTGFWEVSTTSVVGFGQQGRVFEVFDNTDGTLSIVSTVFDHAAPPDVHHATRAEDWTSAMLASLSRELAVNDNRWLEAMAMLGHREDRNVELVVRAPFPLG